MLSFIYDHFRDHEDPLDAMYQYNARLYVYRVKYELADIYEKFQLMERKYIAENKFKKLAYIYKEMRHIVMRGRNNALAAFPYEHIHNYMYDNKYRQNETLIDLFMIPQKIREEFLEQTRRGETIDVLFVIEIFDRFYIPHSRTWALALKNKTSLIHHNV